MTDQTEAPIGSRANGYGEAPCLNGDQPSLLIEPGAFLNADRRCLTQAVEQCCGDVSEVDHISIASSTSRTQTARVVNFVVRTCSKHLCDEVDRARHSIRRATFLHVPIGSTHQEKCSYPAYNIGF